MSEYLRAIARRDHRVVRVADFPGRDAGPELRRLARAGSLLRLAHGYFALVPEANRQPGTSWRPAIEAAALGVAVADYGKDTVALLGPSAARMHGCYPRGLAAAVVAVPRQRGSKETVVGRIQFVVRDVAKLDLVRAQTELGAGWVSSVEETLLDLAGNWPRWPVSEATRGEMLRLLAARASKELVEELGTRPGSRAAYQRIRELLDASR